jgi:hypothetical protein
VHLQLNAANVCLRVTTSTEVSAYSASKPYQTALHAMEISVYNAKLGMMLLDTNAKITALPYPHFGLF